MDSLKINLKNETFQKITPAKMLDKKDFWEKGGFLIRTKYTHYAIATTSSDYSDGIFEYTFSTRLCILQNIFLSKKYIL